MDRVTQQLLDVDVAANRLTQALGHTDRAEAVRKHLSELRRTVAHAELFHLVAQANDMDAADLVRQAVEKASQAGLSWQDIAVIVNTASEQRRSL